MQIQIVVTLQMDYDGEQTDPPPGSEAEKAFARSAREAVENALRRGEDNGFEHSLANQCSIGLVDVCLEDDMLAIEPPPLDPHSHEPLHRVVYQIDVPAKDAPEAAKLAWDIFRDSESIPPFFEVIDSAGNVTEVDLADPPTA